LRCNNRGALGHAGSAPDQNGDVAVAGHGLNAAMTSASHTRPAKNAAAISSRRVMPLAERLCGQRGERT
jgi:hypothetical protein